MCAGAAGALGDGAGRAVTAMPKPAGGADVRRWFFNAREVAALRLLLEAGYPYAVALYQLELRLVMDFTTGVVGLSRRISERGLLELLHRAPVQGSHYREKRRGRSWLQRQLSALEKFGLVERVPQKQLVFRLPLADSGVVRIGEERTYERTLFRDSPDVRADTLAEISAPKITAVSIACDEALKQKAPMSGRMSAPISADERTYERTTSVKSFTTTTDRCALGVGDLTMEQLMAVDMALVVEAFHSVLPGLPRVRFPDSPGYRGMVAQVWFAPPDGKHQTAEFWRWYFAQCRDSDFLMGRAHDSRRGRFKASFKYLLDRDTFVRVMNGEFS